MGKKDIPMREKKSIQDHQAQPFELTSEMKQEIDHWVAKFPADKKQSALLSALRIVQDETHWLSNAQMDAVAAYLDLPRIAVYEVATFYSMYDLKPAGRHKIYVCTNISCMLRGCRKIVDHLQARLGVGFGEMTEDGRFSLKEAECLAACTNAPMMQINREYYENLTPEKVDEILESLD